MGCWLAGVCVCVCVEKCGGGRNECVFGWVEVLLGGGRQGGLVDVVLVGLVVGGEEGFN